MEAAEPIGTAGAITITTETTASIAEVITTTQDVLHRQGEDPAMSTVDVIAAPSDTTADARVAHAHRVAAGTG